MSQQIQNLTDAIARTQAQLQQSQRQLDEMRKELNQLQSQVAQGRSNSAVVAPAPYSVSPPPSSPQTNATTIEESQGIEQTQIATLEQSKIGSESRYPVKIMGLLLFNGFVNTGAVDMAATPTVAFPGAGSTGASVRQTILGIDAQGPHLFGASSYADIRVDFDGLPNTSSASGTPLNYSGNYDGNATLLRLRTAHAGLQWNRTEAYFALDRPILSPDTPASLTAIANPEFAWSGNLWTWNPQLGINQDFPLAGSRALRLQAALIDVGDAPLTPIAPIVGNPAAIPASTAEQSRWPGVEARIALLGPRSNNQAPYSHFGVGGFFGPHFSSLLGHGFDSWAATLDTRLLLPVGFEFSASAYRGQALGGLGAGAYKDFVYEPNVIYPGFYIRPLDDVGGWAQLKKKFSERIEANAALGIDNAFARELQYYASANGTTYQNLARNHTYSGSVIFSPSAYLLFSLEYRRLESSPVIGQSAGSNIFGLGAGYKF